MQHQMLDETENLKFFGKINASISHELKNTMAIISETAGLLQDLTEMAARGQKADLNMLNTCSRDIIEEIDRGFAIIKQMNAFSHSADHPAQEVNLSDVIIRMIALSKFLSSACKISFAGATADAPVIFTCPFELQKLIYDALVFAFESVESADCQIEIKLTPQPDGSWKINFSGLGHGAQPPFTCEKTKSFAASMGIDIIETDGSQCLGFVVPERFKDTKEQVL